MKSSHASGVLPVTGINAAGVAEVLALPGTLMLAHGPRLAAEWKRRLVSAATGPIIATPPVEDWAQWLGGLARRDFGIPVPFNALQELQLWERIIGEDMPAVGRAASGLARHACAAHALIREFRIDVRELHGAGEEAEALARWIAAMRRMIVREGRVLAADVPELLLPVIGSMAPRHILLDGFDRFTPMQQALLQTLSGDGVRISSVIDGADAPGMPVLTACADAEAECRHVAGCIAEAIGSDAQARIAVVTGRPEDAGMLRRIMDESLLPAGDGAAMQAVAMTGMPLAERPLIRQLLGLLHLAGRDGAAHADLAALLFSPAIRGYVMERMARAALDARLREDNRHYLRLQSLQSMAEKEGMSELAGVLGALHAWETAARPGGEWVRAVHTLLQVTGFLQAEVAGRSSDEVRELNAFRECMASLVAIDAVRGRLMWDDFLSLLSSVCRQTPFALPVRFPQVSVLPLEQIAGLRFDVVFAVGFDEDVLPMPARPAPLLPLSLQRRHGLPGATASAAFTESEFLWRQLLRAAPVVQVSYACRRDERELAPSPSLAGVDIRVAPVPVYAVEAPETEPWDDVPPVPVSPAEEVRGGSAIIRNQSACPFRAFAAHRLNLAPLGETEPGVTAADKGALVHRALQFIWESLRSQQALLALDDAARASLIDAAVDHAWQEARIAAADSAQAFERQRMAALLAAWIDEESRRPAFSVVQCEKPYRLQLPASGSVRFPVVLKADRIDRDGEGRKIVIDYKTGRMQRVGEWIGGRMAEPQLPLYAVAEGLGDADAVCFARVRSGDMGFEGLSGEPTGIDGVSVYRGKDDQAEDWSALLVRWQERIDALASEFVAGRCEVAPRDAHACDYCGLEAVCRIDEIGIDRDADGEDAP